MTTIKVFIKRHPLLSFFALAFTISWGGVLIVVGGPSGIPATPEQAEMLFPIVLLAMFAGPSVAGILMTGLLYGKEGFRDLFTRMRRWRVGARWYAVALLFVPLLIMAILFALSLISPEFLPGIFTSNEKGFLLLVAIAVGLATGIFEELGWTSFAIPRMRLRYGVLATGLIVGFLWGAWHLLVYFWGSGTSSGALSLAILLPGVLTSLGVLPAFRVLMVWVYDRSGGSMLVAGVLMHASLTASQPILAPLTKSGVVPVTYALVLTAVLWMVVGAVAVAQGGHLSRQPPFRKRVA